MASDKLFAYSIEESDGKLVITVEGLYAQTAIQHLRAEVETGRGWRAMSRMSPLGALHRLSSQAARAQALAAGLEESSETKAAAPLDLATIFNQGFSESYDDFGKNLDRFASTLTELKSSFDANQAAKSPAQAGTKDAAAAGTDKQVAVK